MHPLLKLAVEAGPLIVFFVANARWGIFVGTASFMVAVALSLAISIALVRRVPTVPLAGAFFVLIFGGLTIYFNDATFIKLKPTVVNGLFAAILLGGLANGKSLIKPLLSAVYAMDDMGWRRLSLRWSLFFVAMAILNEIVWRNVSTDAWVSFKVFGFLPLTLLFSIAQIPLMQRHHQPEDAA